MRVFEQKTKKRKYEQNYYKETTPKNNVEAIIIPIFRLENRLTKI